MRDDLIERARSEVDLRKRMHGDDRSNWSRADRMMEALLTALEAAREDAEFFRWLAVHPNLYTVCDLLRADQYVTLRRACESLAAIDQARGKGVVDEA